MNYKILIVDDEPANLRLLERIFRREYQVISAESGIEALELLKLHDIALIISDQRMPAMTGIEFLKRAAEMRPHTVRVILTSYTDVTALVEAINSGVVYKYVSKPWTNEDLQQTVVRGLQHYEATKEQYELALDNKRLKARLKANEQGFVRLIADALDAKDSNFHARACRTSGYASAIGRRLNLESDELEKLALAAFLHEIERIGNNENSVASENQSPDKENQSERVLRMLASIPEMQDAATAIRHRHEKFDGGAPDRLAGEQIPLYSRIIAVASTYDEMTDAPDAQRNISHEEAVEQLKFAAGKDFDPTVVEAFCRLSALGRIRQAIAAGASGMRLLSSRILSDADDLPIAEILQKFKTEPLLALEVLKFANLTDGEPTAQLMPAMSELGEEKLRLLVREYGLPAPDEPPKSSSVRAVRRAVAAQLLAAHTNIVHPDEAYALGLLADVGESLLLYLFPNEMLALNRFEDDVRPQRLVELFGLDAAQITRSMLEACGLPKALTDALGTNREEMRRGTPLAILMYLADKIARADDSDKFAFIESVGAEVFSTLDLSRASLRAIFERAASISGEQIGVGSEEAIYA